MNRVLATGITGFVGSAALCRMLRRDDRLRIVALARGSNGTPAEARVAEAVREQCEVDGVAGFAAEALDRIRVLDGDVADPDLADRRLPDVDVVFHCAARVNLSKEDPGDLTLYSNTMGTKHVLDAARRLGVEAFHYVSTAYVAGTREGVIYEDELVPTAFNNPYERSKFEAERLVREAGIPFAIYRPSIVVGRLSDGVARKTTGFYHILRFLSVLKKRRCELDGMPLSDWHPFSLRVPVRRDGRVHLVPIPYVQEAVARLFEQPVRNRTYHLTGGVPLESHLIIREIAAGLKIGGMRAVPLPEEWEDFDAEEEELLFWEHMRDMMCYFGSCATYDATNVRAALDVAALEGQLDREAVARLIGWYVKETFPEMLSRPQTAGVSPRG